jgi:hypothetical protein
MSEQDLGVAASPPGSRPCGTEPQSVSALRASIPNADGDTFAQQFDAWMEATGALPRGGSWYHELMSMFEEADALRLDASRYRWLRGSKCGLPISAAAARRPWQFDAAIDAAIQQGTS